MERRNYPLFIFDFTRCHGRGKDTEFISCTSKELPFVAEVTYISENQYQREYNPDNKMVIYDNGRNDCRVRIEVVDIKPIYDIAKLRTLLTRCLKEFLRRKNILNGPVEHSSNANKLLFINEMISQAREQKRANPDSKIIDFSLGVLESIRRDYELKND